MALICPADHPVGLGPFCRICGRDYVDDPTVSTVLVAERATVPEQRVQMPDLSMSELAMSELAMPELAMPELAMPELAMPELAFPELAAPAPTVAVIPAPTASSPTAVQPVVAMPVQVTLPLTEAADEATDEVVESDAVVVEPTRPGVDRTILLAATGAGFVGGLVASLGASLLF